MSTSSPSAGDPSKAQEKANAEKSALKKPYFTGLGKRAHELHELYKKNAQNEGEHIANAMLELMVAILAILDLLAQAFKLMATGAVIGSDKMQEWAGKLKEKIDSLDEKIKAAEERVGNKDIDDKERQDLEQGLGIGRGLLDKAKKILKSVDDKSEEAVNENIEAAQKEFGVGDPEQVLSAELDSDPDLDASDDDDLLEILQQSGMASPQIVQAANPAQQDIPKQPVREIAIQLAAHREQVRTVFEMRQPPKPLPQADIDNPSPLGPSHGSTSSNPVVSPVFALNPRGGTAPDPDQVADDAINITARKKGDDVAATLHARQKNASVTARQRQAANDHFNFRPGDAAQVLADPAKRQAYRQQYEAEGGDFYLKLGAVIKERKESVQDPGKISRKHKIRDAHYKRTQRIAAAVKFAEWGARAELADLRANPQFGHAEQLKTAYEKAFQEHQDVLDDLKLKEQQAASLEEEINTLTEKGEDVAAKQTELQKLKDSLPALERVVQDKKDNLDAQQKAYTDEPYVHQLSDAQAKVEVAEKVRTMYESLAALSRYRSRYTENNFNQRMQELNDLMARKHLHPQQQAAVSNAVANAQQEYNFHKRKFYQTRWGGSTAFDSTGPEFKLDEKYRKKLKIEHFTEGNQKVVRATFSFNRNALSGSARSKFDPVAHNRAYGQMKREVGRMLDVAIAEHNKGSFDNPINVRYAKDNNGKTINQPDIALGIMMDLKKRAIMENREFTVISPVTHQKIQITADRTLSRDEKEMMRHYATQPVGLHKGKGEFKESSFGGAGILRHAGDAAITDYSVYQFGDDSQKDAKKMDRIDAALQGYVNKQVGQLEKDMDKSFGKEIGRLTGEEFKQERSHKSSLS